MECTAADLVSLEITGGLFSPVTDQSVNEKSQFQSTESFLGRLQPWSNECFGSAKV